MAEQEIKDQNTEQQNNTQLESGTYEIIKNRLRKNGNDLREKLDLLNKDRKAVFGSIENTLLSTERITTDHNCTPADMMPVGKYFIFGYNVHIGLKTETNLSDVFSVYTYENHKFKPNGLEMFQNQTFIEDFKNLYKYYRETKFIKFAEIGPYIFMVFRISKSATDIKTFKWVRKGESLEYLGNRFDHEFVFPDQHEFKWTRATRDDFVFGKHPHISIKDKVFVETTEGDLTIKVENNTDTGRGIYSEQVENQEQTLDDAEIHYSIVGNIIILKIKPYQEKKYRYIIYNSKIQEAVRVDALEDSCVLLPEDHGLIFANGYYLQTGTVKMFDSQMQDMLFERKIASPHGEDYLYIFFNRETGTYILLSYNLIAQQVETPIICNGYSIFENGEMIYFKGDGEQKKHHAVQIWRTSYMGADYELPTKNDSYLFKVGNKDIVTAMAESNEVLTLIYKEDSYANLYMDIARYATDILDSFYWVTNEEAHNLADPLKGIKESAESAIDEFEKVVKIRKSTRKQVEQVNEKIEALVKEIDGHISESIDDYVRFLAELRGLRGETITLKELRYVDLKEVENFEKLLEEYTNQQSEACVQFLLKDDALSPYENKVDEINSSVDAIEKVVEAEKLEGQIAQTSSELEMLIDIVSNLKIEDATLTTKIIDNISGIYARFNQINAALKKRKKSLALVEGKAVFNSQIKLISQGLINYLDLCKTPEQCDEQMTKLMVQLEELEGKFAEFEDYVEQINSKREEIYNAFESKKVSLIERRNKLANNLQQSADRILKAIFNRIARFKSINEINGYFASDLMIEKVRDIIKNLLELGDSIKADDIQSRLKTIKEDAVRQLKDKTELFVEGEDVIKFGNFHFNINTQDLSLSMVYRNEEMFYHLAGTNFFEKVVNPEFLKTQDVWEQSVVSEDNMVYRGEFLAYQAIIAKETEGMFNADFELSIEEMQELQQEDLMAYMTRFMGLRYDEGYVKGVHDHDATIILKKILDLNKTSDLLRFPSQARACAEIYWKVFASKETKNLVNNRLKGIGIILKAFPETKEFEGIKQEIKIEIQNFILETQLFTPAVTWDASVYLFHELSRGDNFVMDKEASDLFRSFESFLKKKKLTKEFDNSIESLKESNIDAYKLTRNWVKAFIATIENPDAIDYIDEVAVAAYTKTYLQKPKIEISLKADLEGLRGTHSLIHEGGYHFNYNRFMIKLRAYEETTVVKYDAYTELKKELLENFEQDLRLSEFKPRVLSSFVRNKLIDKVYLPIIGANLAKQIGAAGDAKRTDLMGLLLLISPPGYGKTTLMEYIASRLGIIFMKINGPAIGHAVTAIDPQEAPNAAAREELEKLNLAFEMGDNVMIYLDDIQHCNPEFLQKFISLCDAQRKIEGVYKGRSKTYDFRGKKVCVVMAGNPYTESGEKFKIPDMLANRADIYNLGDVLGDSEVEFKLSYVENCLTSNSVLNNLATKSQKDVHTIIKLAETGNKDGLEFEGNHSPEEINDYVNVIKKLLVVRDVVLAVNMQYIASAAQADEYRTEPAFKLQGSYRNMNKVAEKIVPVMNDEELQTLIYSHYENESQTLTTGAEANFLKFKELIKQLTEEESKRWQEIKETFQRNQRLKGFGSDDKSGQTLVQLESISANINGLKNALESINKKVL